MQKGLGDGGLAFDLLLGSTREAGLGGTGSTWLYLPSEYAQHNERKELNSVPESRGFGGDSRAAAEGRK